MPSTLPHACSPALLSSLARVQYGETPLHNAAYCRHTATAALLIEKGAEVHAKDGVSGGCRDVGALCLLEETHIEAAVAAAFCAAVPYVMQ